MRFSDLLRLYRARMASRAAVVQEAFAVLGIAVGVALLFASQVASTSLVQSVRRLTGEIVGDTQLQVEARGPDGFEERVLDRVRDLPGVARAFPVLEAQASVVGPRGARAVFLLGVDPRDIHAHGALLRRFSSRQLSRLHAIALPAPVAEALGARALETVSLQIRGETPEVLLGAVLGEGEIGALAHSPVAIAPVAYAQRLAGLPARISRVFVRVEPGHEREVHSALVGLAAGAEANVEPADFDATLFGVASSTESQGESVFSAISALVGFMFALTAMFLTAPARRRLIEDIRPQGATRAMIAQILLLDAGAIGAFGCLAGLGIGELLSVSVFHSTPGYLTAAFPIGSERVVSPQSIVLACVAGILAACLGVIWPLRDLLAGDPGRGEARASGSSGSWAGARVVVGVACLALTTVVILFRSRGWFGGIVALAVALACLLPLLFDLLVACFDRFQERFLDGAASALAVSELGNPRTRVRSLAVAATGAIAVFGAVSVGGAKLNLQRGLQGSASAIDEGANVWVAPGGEAGLFATAPFRGVDVRRLRALPGVAAVGVYRGSFLDWGDRRLWIRAPPSGTQQPIPPSQLAEGDLARADSRVREGGWAVLSQALAAERRLRIGSVFVLPAPRPVRLRVAALSTNLGWSPGAIVLNAGDYARAWGSGEPSAYEIRTEPGASPGAVRRLLARALGGRRGLSVETLGVRRARHYALIDQGLSHFEQIELLILIAGALAIAGAMASMLWQRRGVIAFMKVDGYRRGVLWRWLLCESAIMLVSGCSTGALFGLYGQLLISHALATVTGLPVALGVEALIALSSFLIVSAVATAIVAIPGYLAVRVPASTVAPA